MATATAKKLKARHRQHNGYRARATGTHECPTAALRFAAGVELAEKAAENGLAARDVRILARTTEPVYHWWWGLSVHDMDGMTIRGESIIIDYCHRDSEVIGYADKMDSGNNGLVVQGQIVPFQEGDRAQEVLFRSDMGTPYQASIYFLETGLVIEQVPEGVSVEVNGGIFTGPGTIFRVWELGSLAVCPNGVDPGTETELSGGPQVRVNCFSTNATTEPAMSTDADVKPQADAPAQDPANQPAGDPPAQEPANPPAGDAPAQDSTDNPADEPAAAKVDPDNGPATPPPANNELAAQGKRFIDAFGEKGAVYFTEGLSYEQASGRFAREQQAHSQQVNSENEELRKRVNALGGETESLSSDSEPSDTDKQTSQYTARGCNSNLAAFAAGIEVPKGNLPTKDRQ